MYQKFKIGDLVIYYVDSVASDGTYPSITDFGVVVKCATITESDTGRSFDYLEVLWSDGSIVHVRHDDFTDLELINLS